MLPESRREAEEWLVRAERDLLVAERALGDEPKLPDATAYHAQQAAEKALKGFLAANGLAPPRGHDLVRLVGACQTIDPAVAGFLTSAQLLTPYAARFRYPGGPLEPDLAEAEQALAMASAIVRFVRGHLSG